MIKKLHFDPKHPENHNMYISNSRRNEIHCYDGDRWNKDKKDEVIKNIIRDKEYLLSEWLESGEYPRETKNFERYLELKEKDGVTDEIESEIKMILYNNRNIPKSKK